MENSEVDADGVAVTAQTHVSTPASLQPTTESEEPTTTASQPEASQGSNQGSSLCFVCEKSPSKYKCPRCYIPYCSVSCNKLHRETHTHDPEPPPQPTLAPQTTAAEPSRPSSNDPFQALEQSAELKHLFKKYPRLPEQLLQIHSATLAPSTETPKIPASLLKDLPTSKTSEWDSIKAIASGKAALRDARKAEGEEGRAIREYSELVLHLTNNVGPNKR